MSGLSAVRAAWARTCGVMLGSVAACAAVLALAGPAPASAAGEGGAFGVEAFSSTLSANAEGAPALQAGSHPYAMTTSITFAHHEALESGSSRTFPDGSDPKDIEVALPAGVIVNPQATEAKCTDAEIESATECPNSTAVGEVVVHTNAFPAAPSPVFNMVPQPGAPAELAFNFASTGAIVRIVGNVRTGSDYGIDAKLEGITQKVALYGVTLQLWGDPTSESHDKQRGLCGTEGGEGKVKQEEEEIETQGRNSNRTYFCAVRRLNRPLLTMPSSCGGQSLVSTVAVDSWLNPGNFVPAGGLSAGTSKVEGCEKLSFTPSLSVKPTTTTADSPTGLEVSLRIPQEESLTGLAEADLKDAVVALPRDLTVSPSAANGLEACSEQQIGYTGTEAQTPLFTDVAATCPDGSKLGEASVETPLLEHPLKGYVYLARQGENPFESVLAIYLVVEGSGVLVKLAGHVEADPVTGQLTTSFQDNPQLPFDALDLKFFGGPRAALSTPSSCGTYQTTSLLSPWSGTFAATPSDSFEIGSGCAVGFAPSFVAGSSNPQAGGYSPFSVTLSRQDAEQDLAGVQVTTPVGLLGMISSVPLCGEAQAAAGSCPAASQIGHATVTAGPGTEPSRSPRPVSRRRPST